MTAADPFLANTSVVDWRHPAVAARAWALAAGDADVVTVARRAFEFVRDEIKHSADHGLRPVTCTASDVLREGSGYCYAKSHLLAALLRANGIPAGFCYQRLSLDDAGPPYALHGFNAVRLPEYGWYRIDPRGNRTGVDARFEPPIERLAFTATLAGELDLPDIYADPLPVVTAALHRHRNAPDLARDLPDWVPSAPTPGELSLKPDLRCSSSRTEVPMSQSELVVVETFANRIEAELAQGVLEGAGIDSLISADDAGGQYANVWLTGIRLLVRSEDARQAKEVLREPAPGL